QLTLHVEPPLNDLVAVEVGAERILERGDKEGWRLTGSGGGKVASHRYALGVTHLPRHPIVGVLRIEIEAAEEAHRHARPGSGVRLATLQRVENGLARVFPCPDRSVAGCA